MIKELNKQYSVLIVEDEFPLLSALSTKLKLENFIVFTAKNGEEGLAVAIEKHPDLILLDIIMPKMDGITMLDQLRNNSWGKTAKVIILSNLSDKEKFTKVMERGINDYIIKSDWKIESIVTKVKEMLEL